VPADQIYFPTAFAWTNADEFHRWSTNADFWVNTKENANPCIERYVLLDSDNKPVFFFRLTRAARVDIQFAPGRSRRDLLRNRNSLMCGFSWLKWIAQKSNIGQLIFQTSNPPLRAFCEKYLGFHASEGECVFGMEAIVQAEQHIMEEVLK